MSETKFNNKYRIPSARWTDWDYGAEGAYFITICTAQREHYFGNIENGVMNYSKLGKIAVKEWKKSTVTMQARKLNLPFDWQARYHDRVIRDDDEFRRIAAYIEQNPANWENDEINNLNFNIDEK